MQVLDAYIPEGALSAAAEARLMKELTDILLSLLGVEPEDERARTEAVIFIHRPLIHVAGKPAGAPRYRFVPWVSEGQWDDDVRRLVVKAMTEAVARAERRLCDEVRARVWVCPTDGECRQECSGAGRTGDARLDGGEVGE